MADLASVVDLGTRWGVELARAAAAWDLAAELGSEFGEGFQHALMEAGLVLGEAPVVSTLRYENPFALVLIGSGLLMAGLIQAARFMRDYREQRRVARAAARQAESEARFAEARTRLYEWAVDETRQGRAPLPVSEVLHVTDPSDLKALARLAERPITLALPRGSE